MKSPVVVCLSLAMAAPVSYAHHSIAIYNENEAVSVTGNVVESMDTDFGAFAIDEPYSSAVASGMLAGAAAVQAGWVWRPGLTPKINTWYAFSAATAWQPLARVPRHGAVDRLSEDD